MVPDVDDHVQPESTHTDDRRVESVEQDGELLFEVRPLSARTQTDPGPQLFGDDVLGEGVHPEVRPRSRKGLLHGSGDGRLARPGRPVQNDDDAGVGHTDIIARGTGRRPLPLGGEDPAPGPGYRFAQADASLCAVNVTSAGGPAAHPGRGWAAVSHPGT